MRKVFFSLFILFSSVISFAQFSLTGPSYSQNFDVLANTGTSSSIPTGWFFLETGTNQNSTYTAGNGSSNTGDTYSFGAVSSTERALGCLQSGNLIPSFGFYFTNNTGTEISTLLISYKGEQWRLGATGRVDQLDFEYSTNATSLNTGSWVDANAFDFVAPVTSGVSGALDGNTAINQASINSILVGLSIPDGANFFIRWTDFNATGADDGLAIDDFSLTIVPGIPITPRYYRSVQSGDWNNLSTWESSDDNTLWTAATSVPASNAYTITISSGDSVTISTFISIDEVVIKNNAVVNYTGGGLGVTDGPGIDVSIQTGGVFQLSYNSPALSFGTGNPTINVATGGIVRIAAGGYTNTGTGVNADNFIYQHQSILEYTLSGGFATSSVVFFPNVDEVTIPVFRTTANFPDVLLVGANAPTQFNGLLECAGTATIRWQNSGNKIFRNGIINNGVFDYSAGMIDTAKFIINGSTAQLGGSGQIVLPSSGLLVGSNSGTSVDLISSKVVNGNVHLLPANTFIDVTDKTLTISGSISGAGQSSYFKTSGTGALILKNITTERVFPIGHSTYNPLSISHTGAATDFSARVNDGINPAIAVPTYGIQRTWYIKAESAMAVPNVSVSYQYAAVAAGATVLPDEAMEILQNDGIAWSIISGNDNIQPTGTDPAWKVSTTMPVVVNNASFTPYVIGKKGGWILPINCIISCTAKKVNQKGIIQFEVNSCNEVRRFEIQRAVSNNNYLTIDTVLPDLSKTQYSYTDHYLQPGRNLYRVKVIGTTGSVKYSNSVPLFRSTNGFEITSLAPNPVIHNMVITVHSAEPGLIYIALYNLSGNLIKKWQSSIATGSSSVTIDISQFAAGLYYLEAQQGKEKSVIRVLKQ